MEVTNNLQNKQKVICSTSPEEFADFFIDILKDYADSNSDVRFIDLDKQNIDYKTLHEQESLKKNSLIIFGGHGKAEALILEQTEFYNKDHFELGPKLICAFACSSGSTLGEKFVRETNGSYFGYDDDIDYIIEPELRPIWKKIIHSIINLVFSEHKIDENTIELIEQIYTDVIEEIDDKIPLLRLLKMFLEDQKMVISRY